MRRVLLCSTQVPSYGGAATAHYLLFAALQSFGYDAHYLSLVTRHAVKQYEAHFGHNWANPDGLRDVHLYAGEKLTVGEHPELRDLVRSIGATLVLGRNHVAPCLLKSLRPEAETWFLPSSNQQLQELCRTGRASSPEEGLRQLVAIETASLPIPPSRSSEGRLPAAEPSPERVQVDWELEAVRICDRIICNSDITRRSFVANYPAARDKILPNVLWSAPFLKDWLRRQPAPVVEFASRPIDLLFVASRWDRAVKSYSMVKNIIEHCRGKNIHVVGECADPIGGATYHGLITHRAVLELMRQAKALVATSLYDSSPNVLFEASLSGCNLVTSKKCGNWTLCNQALLADPYSPEAFLDRSRRAMERRYEDDLVSFLNEGPPQWFFAEMEAAFRRVNGDHGGAPESPDRRKSCGA